MNKSINNMLEEIRGRIDATPLDEKEEPKPGSGKRFQALVAKLRKKKGVKDPEALAAWIGRKKYGKERFANMGENIDTGELFVFEDVEDVIAFVEGLENLLDEGGDPISKLVGYLRTASTELEDLLGDAHRLGRRNRKWMAISGRGLDIVAAMRRLHGDINQMTVVGEDVGLSEMVQLPSEEDGGKPEFDDHFKAGFAAGKKATKGKDAEGLSKLDPNKAYRSVSRKYGSWWIDGYKAAIALKSGAHAAGPARIAKKMGLVEALDHSAMGAYRRVNPTDAPKAYKQVQKAAQAYLNYLQGDEEVELRRKFIFAANALKKSIEGSYGEAEKAMPGTLGVWNAIRTNVASKNLIGPLRSLLNSDEMKIGTSRVRK